jgi:hypothetical protein
MTANISTPAGQDIRVDIAALMTDLQDLGAAKHNAAATTGQDTLDGRNYYGQGHAYLNAAMWLQQLLDAHTK